MPHALRSFWRGPMAPAAGRTPRDEERLRWPEAARGILLLAALCWIVILLAAWLWLV
jgi:hypothetical protein